MPPSQDERTLLTLFADVHYLLTPRSHRPAHHRFERASYFYLYTHLTAQTTRVEIANNPGTPHQDAIAGPLSIASVSFSYKQPSLVSFTFQSPPSDSAVWHIKDQQYLYPLHGADVYFWTERDAARFVDALKAFPQGTLASLDIHGKPPQPQPAPLAASQAQQQRTASTSSVPLSPVVQKLEQAAGTPAYGHSAQQRDSVSTIASVQPPAHSSTGLPPPPPQQQQTLPIRGPTGPASISPPSTSGFSPPPQPLAYNPAAPPAPEARAHREKTPPPPEDTVPGAGPVYATGQPFASYAGPTAPQQQQQQPSQVHRVDSSLYAAPTPPVQTQRVNSLPFQNYGAATSPAPPYAPQPASAQPTSPGQTPSYLAGFSAPPATSPAPSGPSPGQYTPQSPGLPPAPGYGPGVPGGTYTPDAAAIHATAYRPSEAEMAAAGKNGAAGGPGKSGRFDRGVDRFLKKLDKSWG